MKKLRPQGFLKQKIIKPGFNTMTHFNSSMISAEKFIIVARRTNDLNDIFILNP